MLDERILDNLRHVPTAVVGSLLNAAAVALAMAPAGHGGLILAWLGAVFGAAGLRYRLYWRCRRAGWQLADARADQRWILGIALASGVLWGLGIAAAASVANERQFVIIALLSGGMLGASVLTYASMALGAVLFMAPICAGTIVAWALFPGASLWVGALFCVSYLVILSRGAFNNQAAFTRAIAAREQLREAGATVQLLLNDFEAQAADWLWQVDARGAICAASRRFGEAARRPWQLLEGMRLLELFDDCPERDRLAAHLAAATPFRDLTLPLTLDGAPHWWTLSAQPWQTGMRGVASDVSAQKRAEARVSHMAHYDGLTNLANRFLFNDRLAAAMRGQRGGQVAVLYLDLDRFKQVNDTLGHAVGDRLLCEVARRIERVVRQHDLVARLGGDEFALLLVGPHSAAVAHAAAERIIAALEEPCHLGEAQVLASTSVGLAVAAPGECDGPTLLRRADLALYEAKARGRSRFAAFEPELDRAASERRELEMDLREALNAGQFELHYQPQIDIVSGATLGYEALVRWRHPRRGTVMPDAFIALAEETGLIVPLGEWILRRACQELALWPAHLRLAVNLSAAQLRGPGLLATLTQALAENALLPSRLELEVTESVALHDDHVQGALLRRLRGLGVRIALDDFGTGYSSLNYLRAFPFDKIKIDRCFITPLGEGNETLPIVRAVIALARAMGMRTTAEGVENEAQLAVLAAEGCDEAQGFLFSRPYPAEEFTDLRRPGAPYIAPLSA